MKSTIIGCCLTIVGAFNDVALIIFVSKNAMNLNEWPTSLGRFWTAANMLGLTFPIIFSSAVFFIGLLIFLFEYFKKE